jgi:OOP family OmpA-OmpF porin
MRKNKFIEASKFFIVASASLAAIGIECRPFNINYRGFLMHYPRTAAAVAVVIIAFSPLTAIADSGFFLGGAIGSASLDEDFDGLIVDSSTTSIRLVAGWRFNDYFAFEGGYHSFGDFEDTLDIGGVPTPVSVKADGWTLGGIASIPVGEQFSLFGRVGAFFWDGDAEVNNISVATPEDSNLYLGAGADYAFTEKFSLTGDWTRYELEDAASNVFSIGFQFRF